MTELKSKVFNQKQIDFIVDNVEGNLNKALTEILNAEFNTDFTLNQVTGFKHRNNLDSGITGYPKGHKPHNVGKKREEYLTSEQIEKMKKTQFKKGLIPATTKPVGSERTCSKDGYLWVKVAEPSVWKAKHRHVWEKHHGKIPDGYVINFIDGDRTNTDINNLDIAPRHEMAVMNKNGLRYEGEAYETGKLMTKLKVVARKDQQNE